jgi:hypothetical protein
MTITVLAAVLFAFVPIGVQDKAGDKPPRKGDRVVVRGCVNGAVLDGIEVAGAEDPHLPPGLTFRLTGDKKLLKQLRSEENGRKVEIAGVLKSELPQDGQVGTKIGKTRITVGAGPPDRMQRNLPPHRPVLEVKSYEPLAIACGA